jgi:hypothetical protein
MQNTTLIIDGLPLSYTSLHLTALLGEFGLVECFIVTDPLGVSLRFGYARLMSDEAVDRAISTLTGRNIGGNDRLLLKRALPSALISAKRHLCPVSH